MSEEIGPFEPWRLIVALVVTATVCLVVWLVIEYSLGAFEPPQHTQDQTAKPPASVWTPVR